MKIKPIPNTTQRYLPRVDLAGKLGSPDAPGALVVGRTLRGITSGVEVGLGAGAIGRSAEDGRID